MDKNGKKTRDIKFYSEKNKCMMCVHSAEARAYAGLLENDPMVASYETCVPLDTSLYAHILPVDIRAEYLTIPWASDFLIHFVDGHVGVREIVTDVKSIEKRAAVEKLELSRRYWRAAGVKEWRLVQVLEKEKNSDK